MAHKMDADLLKSKAVYMGGDIDGGERSVMRFTHQTSSIAGHFHNSLAHQTLKGRGGVPCPLELG